MDITITLNQDEIIESIKDHLAKNDVITAGKDVDINLVAGRGPAGHSAVIAIKGNLPMDAVASTTPAPKEAIAPPVLPAKKDEVKPPVVKAETKSKKVVDDPFAEEAAAEEAEAKAKAIADAAAAKATEAANTPEGDDLFGNDDTVAEVSEEVDDEVTAEEEESLFGA